MPTPAESPNPNSSLTHAEALKQALVTEIPFIVKLFATGFFTGYSPIATGTVGSALAVAIYFIPGFEHPASIMTACFLGFILGANAAGKMESRYGHDPSQVTIDEVVGMWVTLFLQPKSLGVVVVAFFLFRIMDIVKPFPARQVDRAKGGLGIMLDDVIAAVYANLVLHLALLNQTIHDFLLQF
ncbi:MAG TPA: phosphatidylglycerophosphatase A [Bacteroidota bacterium]|nr:phosphatidylglycerophosphatase A [Bacteroidota bacterium]